MANLKLIEIKEDQKDNYNHFLASCESGSFLQSFEWGEWQVRLGRAVYRFKIEDDSGAMIGIIQLIKMPLPLGRYYLYAPLGPVIGRSEESEVGSWIFESALNLLRVKFSDAVFIRIEPKDKDLAFSIQHLGVKTANIQPGKTLIIDLSKSEEELLAGMHPKTRYNIRLAEKHGVEIKEELEISIGHGIYFKEAIDLICDTSKRQGFKSYPFEYYQNLVDLFALQSQSGVKAHLYKAIYQNNLLATAIMIDFGKVRTFLFGGSSSLHKNVMAPYLMHYQAMLDAKALGFDFYDFWGIETSGGETPGFVKFKLGFAHSTSSISTSSGSATGSLASQQDLTSLTPQLDSGSFRGGIKEYAGAYDLVVNPLWYKAYKVLRKLAKLKK